MLHAALPRERRRGEYFKGLKESPQSPPPPPPPGAQPAAGFWFAADRALDGSFSVTGGLGRRTVLRSQYTLLRRQHPLPIPSTNTDYQCLRVSRDLLSRQLQPSHSWQTPAKSQHPLTRAARYACCRVTGMLLCLTCALLDWALKTSHCGSYTL